LGGNNDEVLGEWLNLSEADIQKLRDEGVI